MHLESVLGDMFLQRLVRMYCLIFSYIAKLQLYQIAPIRWTDLIVI